MDPSSRSGSSIGWRGSVTGIALVVVVSLGLTLVGLALAALLALAVS